MKDDSVRELALFTEALTVPRLERAAFFERKCGTDKKLRRRLEALILAHDRLGNFLEEPPMGGPSNESN